MGARFDSKRAITKAIIDALGLSHDSLVDVSQADHHDRNYGHIWIHESTSSPSEASSVSFTSLSVHDLWLIIVELIGSTWAELRMRLNNDTNTSYYIKQREATAISAIFEEDHFKLCIVTSTEAVIGNILIEGHKKGSNDTIAVNNSVKSIGIQETEMIYGRLISASGDLSQIDIYPDSGTITGKVILFYHDFPA